MTREELLQYYSDFDNESELVTSWNTYCEENNLWDDFIFSMDDFDALLEGKTPSHIANMIHFGEYNPTDDWVMFDAYGNVKTVCVAASAVDLEALVDWELEQQ